MHSADASDRALVDTSARVGLREPLLVFALASLTNFLWLGRKSVWLDEAVSVEHTLGGFRNVLYIIRWQDPNSGLYYLLLTAWTRVFGAGEWAIRAPSAVLAAATAALVYLIGLHLSGRATARLAALLIALNAYVITFGQTARGYALVLFLVTLATWCLVRSAEHPSRPLAALYVASAVLSFHAHYFGALVVAAHGLALLISGRLRRVHVYCAIVIAIGCLPMLYIAATHGRAEVAWIQVPTPRTLLLALTNLAGISLAALGLLSALALRSVTSSRDTSGRWRTNLLLTWLLLPLLSVYMLSQRVPLFHSRYFLICAPALVLLAQRLGIQGQLQETVAVGVHARILPRRPAVAAALL